MEEILDLKKLSQTDLNSLIQFLTQFVTEDRKLKFNSVLSNRLKNITVVLEDVFQSHNTSAILRTCDLLGVQKIHFIENKNRYKISGEVALGSEQWLSIERHPYDEENNNTNSCLNTLKNSGFKIVATSPHKNGFTPYNLPIDAPIALVLGTEKNGISEEVKSCADYFLQIPMYGFTESFNVSVSAGVCLYPICERIRDSGIDFGFKELEKLQIEINWLLSSIPKSNLLLKEFKKNNKFVN